MWSAKKAQYNAAFLRPTPGKVAADLTGFETFVQTGGAGVEGLRLAGAWFAMGSSQPWVEFLEAFDKGGPGGVVRVGVQDNKADSIVPCFEGDSDWNAYVGQGARAGEPTTRLGFPRVAGVCATALGDGDGLSEGESSDRFRGYQRSILLFERLGGPSDGKDGFEKGSLVAVAVAVLFGGFCKKTCHLGAGTAAFTRGSKGVSEGAEEDGGCGNARTFRPHVDLNMSKIGDFAVARNFEGEFRFVFGKVGHVPEGAGDSGECNFAPFCGDKNPTLVLPQGPTNLFFPLLI